MEQNSDGLDQHVIKIWEVNKDHVASMEAKISTMPRLLTISAGQSSCCIFRVVQSQVQLERYAYHPHIVSVGPYHYKEQPLKMIQEHKWRFLGSLLSRTRRKDLGLEDYLKSIKGLEDRARGCYSEIIDLHSDEFVEMMVLDGCFIIEFFRILCGVVQKDKDDPIFSLAWVQPFLLRDFIKLENQIPFFILQTLFDLSKMTEEESFPDPSPSLVTLALRSFDTVVDIPHEAITRCQNLDVKHLHDLLRSSLIPENLSVTTRNLNSSNPSSQIIIECVTKLRKAGINFKVGNSDSFLDVKFRRGVIKMPCLSINDFTSPFLLNCVAFEQSYKHCSQHFTTYASLMDCLVNTYNDVEILCESGIIENYFSTNGDVSRLFNIMGKDVSCLSTCYLDELFDDVNKYSKNNWHVQLATLKYTYFSSPWSFISALAAVILLVLTVAQTFYTIFPR